MWSCSWTVLLLLIVKYVNHSVKGPSQINNKLTKPQASLPVNITISNSQLSATFFLKKWLTLVIQASLLYEYLLTAYPSFLFLLCCEVICLNCTLKSQREPWSSAVRRPSQDWSSQVEPVCYWGTCHSASIHPPAVREKMYSSLLRTYCYSVKEEHWYGVTFNVSSVTQSYNLKIGIVK